MTVFNIIIIITFIICLVIYFKWFKRLKIKNLIFIDGTLGSGKSNLSVCIAERQYKKNLRSVKRRNFIRKIFKKPPHELPLLYTNMKLSKIPFVLVTPELLRREGVRFRYKSVLLIDEVSLLADQMCFKDIKLNEELSEFFKLFRHETRGGYCIVNSQSISDCHYSLKYSLADYIYIHSKIRLPFFSILKIQERTYNADNSSVQANEGDIEDNTKLICVLNKYFKHYDTYYLSIFTDSYEVYDKISYYDKKDRKKGFLKADTLITFKELSFLTNGITEEDKEKIIRNYILLQEKRKGKIREIKKGDNI